MGKSEQSYFFARGAGGGGGGCCADVSVFWREIKELPLIQQFEK